jgi:predicted ABC-type ATPase
MAIKEAIVIGGPNGAGKTTAAVDLLPKTLGISEFINADEIARGLSPFNAAAQEIAAGRLMLKRMHAVAAQGLSFAFETTCASRTHVRFLERCRDAGYRLSLVFLWLPSPETAMTRVARRVREGGHNIPDDIVRRRYRLGLYNMRRIYLPLVDLGIIYDNSDHGRILVAEHHLGTKLIVRDADRWSRIVEATS